MKRMTLILFLLLAACNADPTEELPPQPRTNEAVATSQLSGDWAYTVVDTPGGPVPCLAWSHWRADGPVGGVSCNWFYAGLPEETK